jgi:hypothetical protein
LQKNLQQICTPSRRSMLACGVCWVFNLHIPHGNSSPFFRSLRQAVWCSRHPMSQEGIGTNKKGFFQGCFSKAELTSELSPWNALYGHCVVNKGWFSHHLIFTYELFSLDPYIHSLGTIFQETIYNLFIFFQRLCDSDGSPGLTFTGYK